MHSVIRITPAQQQVATPAGPLEMLSIALRSPRGCVLVLGTSDQAREDLIDLMNELALHGYDTLATSLPDTMPAEAQDRAFEALLAVAVAAGWQTQQVAAVGYGTSAAQALRGASGRGLGASISIAPSSAHSLFEVAGAPSGAHLVDTPWLCLLGELAAPASRPAYDSFSELLAAHAPAFTRVVTYPGVGSDFYRRNVTPVEIAASYDHWQRVLEWLNVRVDQRQQPLADTRY